MSFGKRKSNGECVRFTKWYLHWFFWGRILFYIQTPVNVPNSLFVVTLIKAAFSYEVLVMAAEMDLNDQRKREYSFVR